MDVITQTKRKYREQQWNELILGRERSGLTVKAYCAAKGVNPKSYYYWLRKFRVGLCEQTVVALPMSSENPADVSKGGIIKVRRRDITVEIGDESSPATIYAVIGALAGRC